MCYVPTTTMRYALLVTIATTCVVVAAVGHTHTPEEGLGYDGGGMAHMQAQGGGLERPG